MGKIIAIANQKGGVAKTTTAISMAAGLSKNNFKVLAIDTDPQASLSLCSGANIENVNTCYDLLKDTLNKSNTIKIENTIQTTASYDIIVSNLNLACADMEFNFTGKEYILKKTLANVKNLYDYIIIDTPPTLGILTINAFTCSDEIIIPTFADMFAANGIVLLNKTIDTVKEYTNPDIVIAGILLTKFNEKIIIHNEIKSIIDKISVEIGTKVYSTFIRQSIKMVEAQANNLDIFNYDMNNTVAKDYQQFVCEYLRGGK